MPEVWLAGARPLVLRSPRFACVARPGARWCPSCDARWWLSLGAQIAAICLRSSGDRLVFAGVRALLRRSSLFASVARVFAWCSLVPEPWCADRGDLRPKLGCPLGARWWPSSGARWCPSLGAQIAAICLRSSGARVVPGGGPALVPVGARALMLRSPRFACVAWVPAWCSLVP